MPKFGKRSLEQLNTVHPKLMRVAYEVIKVYDHSVIWGHRGEVEQNAVFKKGLSTLEWPNSKHNKLPSVAIDVIPWPKKWGASDREFVELAAHYMRAAKKLDIWIEWGGFFILRDGRHFFDAAHFKLHRREYS